MAAEVQLVGGIIKGPNGTPFFFVKVGKSDALRKVEVTEDQMMMLAESRLALGTMSVSQLRVSMTVWRQRI